MNRTGHFLTFTFTFTFTFTITSIAVVAGARAEEASTRAADESSPAAAARAEATTFHQEGGEAFPPSNLLDGDHATAWCEGGHGYGLDERVTIKLGTQRRLGKITVVSHIDQLQVGGQDGGFSRVKKMAVKVGQMSRSWELPDKDGAFQLELDPPVLAREVSFTINDVHKNQRTVTCLHEIIVSDAPSPDGNLVPEEGVVGDLAPGTMTGRNLPRFHLVLDKSQGSSAGTFLYVFGCGKDHLYRVVTRYPAKYGKQKGPKRRQGDWRTPEGLYRLVEKKKRDRTVHYKYGPYSIWIDYPGIEDIRRGQREGYDPGHSITIHGGRTWATEGCIRVLDGPRMPGYNNISELATRYTPPGTSIRIVSSLARQRPLEPGALLPPAQMADLRPPKHKAVPGTLEQEETPNRQETLDLEVEKDPFKAPSSSVDQGAPRPPKPAPRSEEAAEQGAGPKETKVSIECGGPPGAEVWLDEDFIGTSPVEVYSAESGAHLATCAAGASKSSRAFFLPAGTEITVAVPWRSSPPMEQIVVKSVPVQVTSGANNSAEVTEGPTWPKYRTQKMWGHICFWSGVGLLSVSAIIFAGVNLPREENPDQDPQVRYEVDTTDFNIAGAVIGGAGVILVATGAILWGTNKTPPTQEVTLRRILSKVTVAPASGGGVLMGATGSF